MTEIDRRAIRAIAQKQLTFERQLKQIYVDQLNELRSIMAKVYEKYAVDGVLTKAEMSKYNRLASLETQLIKMAGDSANAATKLIYKMQFEMYQESFYRRAWAIDMNNQIRLSYGLVSTGAVKETLLNDFEKISLQKYGSNARINIRSALQKGLIQGQSYVDMARDLKQYVNSTAYEAFRIMRTEGQTAQNAGAADVYELAEKEGVQGSQYWIASLDDATRESHQAMDGVAMEEDGLFHLPGTATTDAETAPYPSWEGLSAGNRVNCRCSIEYRVNDLKPALRRTREDGVIPYQTYEEWDRQRA